MTLPARQPHHRPPSLPPRGPADERALAEQLRARIALAEQAARAVAAEAEARLPKEPSWEDGPRHRYFGAILLAWSCLAMALSLGILAYETIGPGARVRALPRPALEFSNLSTRYLQSAEGPALEMTGIVRNGGDVPVKPAFTLQLAGKRVAIEEPLKLGGASLPSGAERPFALRLLLPEGTQSISLLPASHDGEPSGDMVLVSPAWTAETPGL